MNMLKLLVQLCLAASVLTSFAMAQDHPIPKPTAEHKILAAEEGTWDATVKSYQNGPDSEPMVSKGVEVNTVVTGGLWVSFYLQGRFRRHGIRRPRSVRLRPGQEEVRRDLDRLDESLPQRPRGNLRRQDQNTDLQG